PIDIRALDVALDRALEVRRLSRGTDFVSGEAQGARKLDEIVGAWPPMQQLFKDVGRVAASRATVLIQGESGTGKELIARIIHSYTAGGKPFIGINCSAIVDTLLESELFGHEKGSFTGAVASKIGKFELAEDGSIFLDEIGELSQNLQAKLLRVPRETLEKLMARSWPGNVRELENVLTRAAVLSQGDLLLEEHLVEASRPEPRFAAPPPTVDGRMPTLDEVERAHIERVFAL